MPSERVSLTVRRYVQSRAKGLCEYCQAPDSFATSPFHCEHIIPQSAGGENALSNLAWSCPRCNNHKHAKMLARDPQTGQRVQLFNPRLKKWHRHFIWSEDFLLIVGRTRTGRATVEALNMNLSQRINLRRALLSLGEHPAETDE